MNANIQEVDYQVFCSLEMTDFKKNLFLLNFGIFFKF